MTYANVYIIMQKYAEINFNITYYMTRTDLKSDGSKA
jgi:hypothetical protein